MHMRPACTAAASPSGVASSPTPALDCSAPGRYVLSDHLHGKNGAHGTCPH